MKNCFFETSKHVHLKKKTLNSKTCINYNQDDDDDDADRLHTQTMANDFVKPQTL